MGLGSSLGEFIKSNLKGSTLQVKPVSEREVHIEADKYILIKVMINSETRKLSYDISSPEWNRPVIVEELRGFDYMEVKVEEDLIRLNLDRTAEDLLLCVDLLRSWAKANKFRVIRSLFETETETATKPKPITKAKTES